MPGGPRRNGLGHSRGMGRMRGGMVFLQTCLLVLLQKKKNYGYRLIEELGQFGIQSEMLDISIIYRALRGLEIEGLITASWNKDSLGPQRKVYEISPEGQAMLAASMEQLRERRREIETLEQFYNETLTRHP